MIKVNAMRVNIEFIIGTIIGVIGIIPVLISIAHGMQKTNLSQLMDKLVCKELSQKERLQVLRSMNRKLLFSGPAPQGGPGGWLLVKKSSSRFA